MHAERLLDALVRHRLQELGEFRPDGASRHENDAACDFRASTQQLRRAQLNATGCSGAVVMHSLFEEQIVHEQMSAHRFLDTRMDSDAEARTFLPDVDVFSLDAEPYLRELERLRKRVDVPIVASLNGTTPGGWTGYAKRLEAAGASAIELNLYEVATSPDETGAAIEDRQIAVVAAVVAAVGLPVTVKLSPFYSSVPAFVRPNPHAWERLNYARMLGGFRSRA